MTLSVDPTGIEDFAAVNAVAAELISSAGSADAAACFGAAAGALGPIGAAFLAAYAPAQANNLAATLLVGAAHSAISTTAEASKVSFMSTDGR